MTRFDKVTTEGQDGYFPSYDVDEPGDRTMTKNGTQATATETTVPPPPAQPPADPQALLKAFLEQHNLTLVPAVIGPQTGGLLPVEDFTHLLPAGFNRLVVVAVKNK